MTLWANLHGGFVFGLLIAALFGLEALVAASDKARVVRQWGLFGLACAVAVCINGNGLEGVVHPLRFTALKMLPLIDEWKPSNPKVTPVFFGVLAVTLALIAWKRPRLHWVRWLLLGGMLALHDIYYPGWIAEIDGARAPILRADILFRGLEVPAGDHNVVFRYAPFSLRNLGDALKMVLSRRR